MKTLRRAFIRTASIAIASALLGGAPPIAEAQESTPPSTGWRRHVDPGAEIFVVTKAGGEITGRLVTASPSGVTVTGASGQSRAVPANTIGWIDTRGDSLRNGALVGAVVLVLPVAMTAGLGCSSHCAQDVALASLSGAAVGAGLGALIDLARRGRSVAYGVSPPPASALRLPAPVGSTADLWSRVRPGDRVAVVTTDGEVIDGRFVGASASSVTVMVNGQPREVAASDVGRVNRRGTNARTGTVAGALSLGLLFAAGTASSGENPAFAFAAGAYAGAFWGAVIGNLTPRIRPALVHGATVQARPVVTGGRRGVLISVAF